MLTKPLFLLPKIKTDIFIRTFIVQIKVSVHLEAPPGFEPGIRVLQTHALPLGYSALLNYMNLKKFYYGKLEHHKNLTN